MAWQVTLKRKGGGIRADLGMGGSGDPPKVGAAIEYQMDGEVIKARATSVAPTSVRNVYSVKLEELQANQS